MLDSNDDSSFKSNQLAQLFAKQHVKFLPFVSIGQGSKKNTQTHYDSSILSNLLRNFRVACVLCVSLLIAFACDWDRKIRNPSYRQ